MNDNVENSNDDDLKTLEGDIMLTRRCFQCSFLIGFLLLLRWAWWLPTLGDVDLGRTLGWASLGLGFRCTGLGHELGWIGTGHELGAIAHVQAQAQAHVNGNTSYKKLLFLNIRIVQSVSRGMLLMRWITWYLR